MATWGEPIGGPRSFDHEWNCERCITAHIPAGFLHSCGPGFSYTSEERDESKHGEERRTFMQAVQRGPIP